MSQILFDFLATNDNASIILVNEVNIGSHFMKLKLAERQVTHFCIEKHFSGGGVSDV